ncbi:MULTISPECIES: monovalent cation:proton antiporter-2 (CPA2) family protein [unclassified Halomonas]|uniref:monovalent cation:proton antiporter-2 (CPA2) family protein n=1 Tax=unclassified Halomonas TaxID=2609666 RepID=UPI001EF70DA5|nr:MULTISPECIES: monovalent cation:proton antiporter-2 (CPA2) family protein [unclassified Halomonas]MCG7575486.1 monovalent cation:proton antiporter-2 (CPA2) family protein [Halomonas sp. MMH1-48]MCG7602548.1 monovalent cation:proton antiporter-2 (CPA2) family protein [Halomonas sp. MM17-34]MCG7611694.1 monovalent cation:proton antiporter-2 (CPA2) family protein [Halomonas sp. MM17-29]MCG7618575.1 monovalent cation:proton antiporter-2 (CPA2) family protein [Halomonas sp. DSH1-27]
MTGYFIQAFIYLVAAVIAVPLAKRFGLGSVLGYLVAGVVIGPVLGLVGQETTIIQHFAEFGVVMMLFLVGMELDPKGLWAMRVRLLGLGGLQVVLTAAAGAAIAWWLGLVWQTALAVGLIFALSSTAIVLQTLNEKGLSKTEGGRSAFSVLLFQDIAVIPMLALIPLLALPELMGAPGDDHGHAGLSLVAHLPAWAHALVVVAAIGGVIVGGYYLGPLLFRYVIGSGLREVFTASALMLVIGIAALMSLVNLSPALGAFLAGIVLANSEFKHEIEANIEPFKGLLLGLFFITVGAGINFDVLAAEWITVLGLGLAVIVVKAAILLALALLFKVRGSNGWLFTLSLAQAGEFGFVLLTYSVQNSVIPVALSQVLSLVVALSMFLTPLLFIAYDRLVLPRYQTAKNDPREADTIEEQAPVIVAGVGRFGQIICRLLRANNIPIVALDHEIEQIENLRNIRIKSYFGDASRSDLLETAGIEHARLLVVAIDDRERAVGIVKHVKQFYPNVWVLARAFDRGHGYQLREAGADDVISETYHSALELGGHALTAMGVHPMRAKQMTWAFVQNEDAHADELFEAWKEIDEGISFSPRYGELFMKLEEALNSAMHQEWQPPQQEEVPVWTAPAQNREQSGAPARNA